MSRTRIVGGALAFTVAILMTAVAFAQHGEPRGFGGPPPGGGPGRHGPGGALGPLARDLNLTDAQKTQIKQLTDDFEQSTKSLREQLFKTGGGPLEGLKDGAFDEASVRAAAQARANIQVELEVAHAKLMSQVYTVLTVEQKAKLAELRQRFEQRRQPPPPGAAEDVPNDGR